MYLISGTLFFIASFFIFIIVLTNLYYNQINGYILFFFLFLYLWVLLFIIFTSMKTIKRSRTMSNYLFDKVYMKLDRIICRESYANRVLFCLT